jgi:hypothetical protein
MRKATGKVRAVRFTDEEWRTLGEAAKLSGSSRSDLIRAFALPPVRKALAEEAAKPRGCVYCKRFTDMQDSIPAVGGGSAHAACAMRASLVKDGGAT